MSRLRGLGIGLFAWVLVGICAGLAWSQLAHPAEFVLFGKDWLMGQYQMSRRFDADGWFVVVGLIGCLVAGLALLASRRRSPLLSLGAGLVGSALAAVIAWRVGLWVAPSTDHLIAQAKDAAEGTMLAERLGLSWWGVGLAWPIGFLIGALAMLLLRPRSGAADGGRRRLGEPDQVVGAEFDVESPSTG